MSNELLHGIDEVLKNEVASRHSYFQLKYFLIGKEPTNQAKMWQCLRELKTRRESLANLELEIDETKDRLALLDINIEKLQNKLDGFVGDSNFGLPIPELDKKEIEINIRQVKRQKQVSETALLTLIDKKKWIEEESLFFLETFKAIQKDEPLKQFDDLEAQKQYWGEKLISKLNLKMLTNNPLDSDLIETIMALPDDMMVKKQTVKTLNLKHTQILNGLQKMNETLKIEGK